MHIETRDVTTPGHCTSQEMVQYVDILLGAKAQSTNVIGKVERLEQRRTRADVPSRI